MRPLAPSVADALVAQNALLAPSPARDANIAALREGAVAVVTGQQACLFLGPLYNLYKAATAVRAAQRLSEESGIRAIPVFWQQIEDHDLPEIAECNTPRANGELLAQRLPASTEPVSVAHRFLPAEVTELLAELRSEVGVLPHGSEHLARLERHYRPGTGWGNAFAATLAELFADEGLVFINPRDPALAPIAAGVHRQALEQAAPIAHALTARTQALLDAGFRAPVHVRAGAPLSFFHPDGPNGPRYRLEPSGSEWRTVGSDRTYGKAAILAALENDPRSFSTSVLLRPVLQDTLLPTAAYVGGPGEIAYFAQLAPVYEVYGRKLPLVVPRAQIRLLEEKTLKILERLDVEPDMASHSEGEILAAAAAGAQVGTELTRPVERGLDDALRALGAQLDDPTLEAAVEKTRASMASALQRLAAKIERAHQRRDEQRVADARRLRQALCPNGQPQERVVGIPYFAARYGEGRLVRSILEAIHPFDARTIDMPIVDADRATAE